MVEYISGVTHENLILLLDDLLQLEHNLAQDDGYNSTVTIGEDTEDEISENE